ncbi:MAG TPA: hypothetical protein VGF94_22425 [Kofleriaceae bacterium]|jgi:hypothetical protein
MRIVLVLLLVARTASAGPDKKCFAGTETHDGKSEAVVVTRELDPAAHEIREHTWRQLDPDREIATTLHVAADGKTFTVERGPMTATGTLEGEPWKWTGYHEEAISPIAKMIADGKLKGDTITVTSTIDMHGTTLHAQVEAKTFDCAELARRRAALDDTAKDAVHACFEGTEKTMLAETRHVVLEQVFEPKRIQLRISMPSRENRFVFAIDGSAITVTNGKSWSGHGQLTGKPGAWTGYRYDAKLDKLDLNVEGTLGGKHESEKLTAHAKRAFVGTIEADAFDCKDIAVRRAALDSAAP